MGAELLEVFSDLYEQDTTPVESVWLHLHKLLKLGTPPQGMGHAKKPDKLSYERSGIRNQYSSQFRDGSAFDRMATDKPGQELSHNAAIWELYLEEAREYDDELVQGQQKSLDTLLIFAALFSAIQTAFLIESKDLLQQDPADISASLLLLIAQSQQRVELGLPSPPDMVVPIVNPSFQPSTNAQWINGIWFLSLGLSLTAALIAMLGKEWLTAYLAKRPRAAYEHSLLRQARLEGLQYWWALHIIALLPSILHASLLLFSIGLILYLVDLRAGIAAVFAIGVGGILVFYLSTIVLGAVSDNCPFVTEASNYLQKAMNACFRARKKPPGGNPLDDIRALLWLANHSRDPSVVDCCYQAMAGLHQLLSPQSKTGSNASTDALPVAQTTKTLPLQLDEKTTINSLLSTVVERFENLLTGTLDLPNPEILIDRHIDAIVAIRATANNIPDTSQSSPPLVTWLELLKLIEDVGHKNIGSGSLNPNAFASLLIAEMKVIDFALCDPTDHVCLEVRSEAQSTQIQSIELPDRLDDIATLRKCANRWLQLVSLVLVYHSSGKILLDHDLLIQLLRLMENAMQSELLNPIRPGSPIEVDIPTPIQFVTPFPNEIQCNSHQFPMGPLDAIMGILSMPLTVSDDLQFQILQSAVAAYISLAPIILRRVLEGAEDFYPDFSSLRDTTAHNTEGCMNLAVSCMLLTADCLLRARDPQDWHWRDNNLFPMLDAVLEVTSGCLTKCRNSVSQADWSFSRLIRRGPVPLLDCLLNRWLLFEPNGSANPRTIKSIITIVTYALKVDPATMIPSSEFAVLMKLAEKVAEPDVVLPLLDEVARWLRSSPQGNNIHSSANRPSQDFIRYMKGFPLLMKLTSREEYGDPISAIIVCIVALAADTPAYSIRFDELTRYDKPWDELGDEPWDEPWDELAILDAIQWVLENKHLGNGQSRKPLEEFNFIVSAADLMTWIKGSTKDQYAAKHPAYSSILSELDTRYSRSISSSSKRTAELYQRAINKLTGFAPGEYRWADVLLL